MISLYIWKKSGSGQGERILSQIYNNISWHLQEHFYHGPNWHWKHCHHWAYTLQNIPFGIFPWGRGYHVLDGSGAVEVYHNHLVQHNFQLVVPLDNHNKHLQYNWYNPGGQFLPLFTRRVYHRLWWSYRGWSPYQDHLVLCWYIQHFIHMLPKNI